jgi:hypothetical protein
MPALDQRCSGGVCHTPDPGSVCTGDGTVCPQDQVSVAIGKADVRRREVLCPGEALQQGHLLPARTEGRIQFTRAYDCV